MEHKVEEEKIGQRWKSFLRCSWKADIHGLIATLHIIIYASERSHLHFGHQLHVHQLKHQPVTRSTDAGNGKATAICLVSPNKSAFFTNFMNCIIILTLIIQSY